MKIKLASSSDEDNMSVKRLLTDGTFLLTQKNGSSNTKLSIRLFVHHSINGCVRWFSYWLTKNLKSCFYLDFVFHNRNLHFYRKSSSHAFPRININNFTVQTFIYYHLYYWSCINGST